VGVEPGEILVDDPQEAWRRERSLWVYDFQSISNGRPNVRCVHQAEASASHVQQHNEPSLQFGRNLRCSITWRATQHQSQRVPPG
jgi:hypothetical protein